MSSEQTDEAFAKYLNEVGVASSDQVDAARYAQSESSKKGRLISLPDILVSQGVLTASMRENIEKKLQAKQAGGIKQLGTFKLLKKLGEGGMGAVYLAEDTAVGRKVALKVLPQKFAKDSVFLMRFRREAKAAGKLNHPNIVAAYSVGEEKGHHYYSMEYCEGEPLDSRLKREKVLAWDQAVHVTLHVARGLEHAHHHGFIHRDIKPANIFQGRDGTVKILDLGLSKNIGDSEQSFLTQTGVAMGTPHYISPEQTKGDRDIDGRTDIYSLGATLYHFITGQTPFDGGTAALIMMKHLSEKLRNPQDLIPDLPDGVVEVIQKMMAKDPADRYVDCADLIADLELLQQGKPPAGSTLDIGKSSIAMRAQPQRHTAGTPRCGGTAGPLQPVGSIPARRGTQPLRGSALKEILLSYKPERDAEVLKSIKTLEKINKMSVTAFWGMAGMSVAGVAPTAPAAALAVKLPVVTAPVTTAQVVDPAPPTTLKTGEVRAFRGHSEWVAGIAISSDGKRAISGSKDKTLRLWNVETGAKIRRFSGHTGVVRGVAFSPDDKTVLSGGEDRTLRLWDVESGQEKMRLEKVTGHVNGVAFSPDGKRVAAGTDDATLSLWEAATGRLVGSFAGHSLKVMGVAFSADGKRLLSGGGDKTARVWNAETGALLQTFTGHAGAVNAVAFSSDGRRVVTSSDDTTARVWDLASGRELVNFSAHTKKSWGVAFLPDGKRVLSGSEDRSVKLWDAGTGKEITHFETGSEVGDLRLSRDGRRFVVGLMDRTMRLWALPLFSVPVTDMWVSSVQALPADKQLELVLAKLKELNPEWGGTVLEKKIENGNVAKLRLSSNDLVDISPLRALDTSSELELRPHLPTTKGALESLAALSEMKLKLLAFQNNKVRDLTPIKNMLLGHLYISNNPIDELTPLQSLSATLVNLDAKNIAALNFSLIKDLSLKYVTLDFVAERDSALLKSLKTLEKINSTPAAEFWSQNAGAKPAK